MPVAHISAQQIGSLNMLSQLLDSQNQMMGNSLQQSQLAAQYMNSLQSPLQMNLQQAESYLALAQFDVAANANLPVMSTGPNPYYMRRAESYAEQGDKLIERMAFWSAFGVIASPIMSRLADKLERVTDEVDGFVRKAA